MAAPRSRPASTRRNPRHPAGPARGGDGDSSGGPRTKEGLSPEEKRELLRRVSERMNRADTPLLEWSLAFRVEEGGPLDFEAFPFQAELYEAFGDRDIPTVDVM